MTRKALNQEQINHLISYWTGETAKAASTDYADFCQKMLALCDMALAHITAPPLPARHE